MSLSDLTTDLSMKKAMDEIREHIRNWLTFVFKNEVQVIPAELSVPRPNPPYITYKVLLQNQKRGAVDEQISINDPVGNNDPADMTNYKIRAIRNFVTSIQFFGVANEDYELAVNAMDLAATVQNSLDLPSVVDFFREKYIAIVNDNQIQDISELVDTETEPRAVYDIEMSVTFEIEDDQVTFIDSLSFEGEFDTNMDGNLNKSTGTVTVN